MRHLFLSLSLLLTFTVLSTAAPVITWIPPYAVSSSKANLETDMVQQGISHLALQFWVPDGANVAKSKYEASGRYDDDLIREIRDTAQAHGIKVMLCVYNGQDGWNWANAKNSFMYNQDAFISSLIAEMNRLNLDGIEVDLEGPNVESQADGDAFITFIKALSAKLRAEGKDLTLASFHSEYHTPGPRHWNELLPYVDGITTMGYGEIGRNATSNVDPAIFKPTYSGQKSMASAAPEKLMIGMPASDSWQGNTAQQQVDWVVADGEVGIGLWDLQLSAGAWQNESIWQSVNEIRGAVQKTYTLRADAGTGGSIDPAGAVAVDSAGSLTFTITPDEGYEIEHISIDGTQQEAAAQYTFADVSSDHSISASFVPASAVTVITPNGGEIYDIGADITVSWTNTTGAPADVAVVASGWEESILKNTEKTSVRWTVPENLPEGEYRIRVSANGKTDMSDAAFTVEDILISDNLVSYETWSVISDDYTGDHASAATLDTSRLSEGIIGANMEVGTVSSTDEIYPYAGLVTDLPKSLTGMTGLTVQYTASADFTVSLDQENLSDAGASYAASMPASSEWKEMFIPLDSFSQPEWVSSPTKLDLGLCNSLSFSGIDVYGSTVDIQIRNLQLHGWEHDPSSTAEYFSEKEASRIRVTPIQKGILNLSVPVSGEYRVSLLTPNGRLLESRTVM
ncbi:MAG: glycosyl hydrolase family 18 protein, partial [Fibrobacterota bacterium]